MAAAVLASPEEFKNQTLNLTGPQALSLQEIAETISEITGNETVYKAETVEEAYASRASYGAEGWMVEGWVSTYTAIADGSLEKVSSDVQKILGHPAQTFTETLKRSLQ